MNNWVAHWPNTLMSDDYWHWKSGAQVVQSGPSGNINYGPQLNVFVELSRSIYPQNVFFVNGYAGIGSLAENVTFLNSSTISYASGLSMGMRVALGNHGRSFVQLKLKQPGKVNYVNDDFPFESVEGQSISILLLHTKPMLWNTFSPNFLSVLSMSWFYSKNTVIQDNILSDHQSSIHLSSEIQSWFPLYLAPFMQLRTEQLIAPPSIWTGTRETRALGSVETGIDIAISRPYWEHMKARIAFPVAAWSSSNGFPDGSHPTPYLVLAVNTSGIFFGSD